MVAQAEVQKSDDATRAFLPQATKEDREELRQEFGLNFRAEVEDLKIKHQEEVESISQALASKTAEVEKQEQDLNALAQIVAERDTLVAEKDDLIGEIGKSSQKCETTLKKAISEGEELRRCLEGKNRLLKEKDNHIQENADVLEQALSLAQGIQDQHHQFCAGIDCTEQMHKLRQSEMSVRQQMHELHQYVGSLREQLHETSQQNQMLHNSLANANRQIREGKAYVSTLHQELIAQGKTQSDMTKILQARNVNASFWEHVQKTKVETDQLKTELKSRTLEIWELYRMKRIFELEHEAMKSDAVAQIQLVSNELDRHRRAIEAADAAKMKVYQLESDITNMKMDNGILSEAKNELQQQCTLLEEEKANLQAEKEVLCEEGNTSEQEPMLSNEQLDSFTTYLRNLTVRYETAGLDVEQNLLETRAQVAELQEEVAKYQAKNSELEEEKAALKEEVKESQALVESTTAGLEQQPVLLPHRDQDSDNSFRTMPIQPVVSNESLTEDHNEEAANSPSAALVEEDSEHDSRAESSGTIIPSFSDPTFTPFTNMQLPIRQKPVSVPDFPIHLNFSWPSKPITLPSLREEPSSSKSIPLAAPMDFNFGVSCEAKLFPFTSGHSSSNRTRLALPGLEEHRELNVEKKEEDSGFTETKVVDQTDVQKPRKTKGERREAAMKAQAEANNAAAAKKEEDMPKLSRQEKRAKLRGLRKMSKSLK